MQLVPAQDFSKIERTEDDDPPGSYRWVEGPRKNAPHHQYANHYKPSEMTKVGITFKCPGGCGRPIYVRIAGLGRPSPGPAWEMVPGAKLTLSPSINNLNEDNSAHWHGYLENGMFRTLPDSSCCPK